MNYPKETTAIVCNHVFKNERQVSLVIRHTDGIWQLVCGQTDHPEDCSDFEVVGFEHLIERQSNLETISNLEFGWMAEYTDDGWLLQAYEE